MTPADPEAAAGWQGGRRPALLLAGVCVGLIVGCPAPAPRPVVIGGDACSHCRMPVVQERFTAEAILATGKTYVFDDVGCMANWLAGQAEAPAGLWVWSTIEGEGWLPAETAVYIRSDRLHTPMGSHLAATRPGPAADSLERALAGVRLDWSAVRALVHAHPAAAAS